jgi:2'-5' RNA ligase
MPDPRLQATLFLGENSLVEAIRNEFNPAQAALIAAHVTLCREDEVADWDEFSKQCHELKPLVLELEFGPPVRNGDLVYLPCVNGIGDFDELRRALLGAEARKHNAHITLMHPRNSVCNDSIFEEIRSRLKPFAHRFLSISLIRQESGGVWETLETIELI